MPRSKRVNVENTRDCDNELHDKELLATPKPVKAGYSRQSSVRSSLDDTPGHRGCSACGLRLSVFETSSNSYARVAYMY
jgi:hypothetical protein